MVNDRLFSLFFGFRAIGCAVLLALAAGCASTSIPLGRGSVSIPRKGWRLDAQERVFHAFEQSVAFDDKSVERVVKTHGRAFSSWSG